jgi:hypothetical protein
VHRGNSATCAKVFHPLDADRWLSKLELYDGTQAVCDHFPVAQPRYARETRDGLYLSWGRLGRRVRCAQRELVANRHLDGISAVLAEPRG